MGPTQARIRARLRPWDSGPETGAGGIRRPAAGPRAPSGPRVWPRARASYVIFSFLSPYLLAWPFKLSTMPVMDTPERDPARPGLTDLPRLFRSIVNRGIDLATARVELIQAEIREEAERRLRRLPHIIIPAVFLLLGFSLLNVGLVAWLAEAIGLTASAFSLAGLYLLIGGVGTWWFLKTGGLNPRDEP